MNGRSHLRALAEAAQNGPLVIVPVDWLLDVLEDKDRDGDRDQFFDFLTVEEVAELVGRAHSTVRTWCLRGLIPGAKKLRGRQWIIPRAGLQSFLEAQSQGHDRSEQRRTRGAVDLSAWRKC